MIRCKTSLSRSMTTAALSITALVSGSTAAFARDQSPDARDEAAVSLPPSSVQVLAHQDDDLFFMNPDVQHAVASGQKILTIYLTAGEGNGRPTWDPPLTREEFAAAREDGARAAYAQMAGVAGNWSRSDEVIDGKHVEVDALAGTQVSLVFLGLPDGGDTMNPYDPNDTTSKKWALQNLWNGIYPSVSTLLPTGSPVTVSSSYTKDELTTVLAALIDQSDATVLRTLDPKPDHRYDGGTGYGVDHADHTYAAKFARAAEEARVVAGASAASSAQYYRGYGDVQLPENLWASAITAKAEPLDAYAVYDPGSGGSGNTSWTHRMYTRYPTADMQIAKNADGSLQAFAVLGGRLETWKSSVDGSSWSGPTEVLDAAVRPQIGVAQGGDGRVEVFANRTGDGHVVACVQLTQGSTAFASTDLGSPNGTDLDRSAETGTPVPALDGLGNLRLFIKNGGGGVSATTQSPGGAWGTWQDLRGSDIQDGLAAVVVGNRVELYAPTTTGIIRFYQEQDNGTFVIDNTVPATAPASPLSVTLNADGRVQMFYRQPSSANVLTVFRNPDGTWRAAPVNIGGPAGVGPANAVRAGDRIMLSTKDATYGVTAAYQTAANGGFGGATWPQSLGGDVIGQPTAAVDSTGRVVVCAIAPDGRLTTARQLTATPASGYGSWTEFG